mgnify:FL=1
MLKILLAEDNDIIREHIKRTLQKDPSLQVVGETATGIGARLLYEQIHPDVVLMDIEMEEADSGIKAADAIIREHSDAKVIYLTSHDGDDTIVKALSNGSQDYIVKGCSNEVLISKVHDVIEGKPSLDPAIQRVLMGEYKRLRKSEENLIFFIQNLSDLTTTEKELIAFFLDGMKVREIASKRGVEIATVKSQIRTLLHKFGVSRSKDVVNTIHELGLEHLFSK